MIQQLLQVKEWSEKFGQYQNELPTAILPYPVHQLRIRLMEEELKEYEQAHEGFDKETLIESENERLMIIAKELADILYVVYGTVIAHGLTHVMETVFDELHRSNMSKLWPDGKPNINEIGKVMKPETYSPADNSFVISYKEFRERGEDEPPVNYEIACLEEGEYEKKYTEGFRVDLPVFKDHKFFLHENPNYPLFGEMLVIAEASSGCVVATGQTITEVMWKAIGKLKSVTLEKFQQMISDKIQQTGLHLNQ